MEDLFGVAITKLTQTSSVSAEGHREVTLTPSGVSVTGNVIPVNESTAKRYGFSIESQLAFTTVDAVTTGEGFLYGGKNYRSTKVTQYANYNLVECMIWQ